MKIIETTPNRRNITIPEHFVTGGWVIGGTTRLLDVWSPSPLILWAPNFQYREHDLEFSLMEGLAPPVTKQRKIWRGIPKSTPAEPVSDSTIFFDTRHDSTANIAHVMQGQIGVALMGLEALGIRDRWRDLIFIVASETPEYSIRLFQCLGFKVKVTSGETISGNHLQMKPKKFPLRGVAARVLRRHAVEIGLLDDSDPMTEGVFLARRNRRTLTNIDEIESIVNREGYRTVYTEDLSAEDQITTIARASAVFGLHGAGLGYLMFRNPDNHGSVIECFSTGFATNWCRTNCSFTGDTWIGGQGDMEPKQIKDMQSGAHSHTHEADNYRLDPNTAEILVRMAKQSTRASTFPDIATMFDAVVPVTV